MIYVLTMMLLCPSIGATLVDIGCIVFNLFVVLLVFSNQRDSNNSSAIFNSASPGTGPSKVRRQHQPAVGHDASVFRPFSFLSSLLPANSSGPPLYHKRCGDKSISSMLILTTFSVSTPPLLLQVVAKARWFELMWVPFFAAKYQDTGIEQYYYCPSLPRTDV